MVAFRNASIQQKLTVITMLTSSVVLLVAGLCFILNDVATMRQSKERDLTALAQIIGTNAASAVTFQDQEAARQTLAALSAKPRVAAAGIYTADNRAFAAYGRPGHPPPPSLTRFRSDGRYYEDDHLSLYQPMMVDGERIGTIYVIADLQDIEARVKQSLLIVGMIFLVCLLVAFALGSRLQRVISGPILELARVARVVSHDKDYSVRAPRGNKDEIGLLIDGFNEMLSQIEKHDHHIQQVNEQLMDSEQRALAANQAKSLFLAKMSHELRTPLNAIIGYSEMLQEEAEDLGEEDLIPDLQKINSAGKHLLALINDILDLSKIEAGKMEVYLEEFEIAPLIEEVVSTVRPLVDKNANRLEVRCGEGLGTMRADLTKVRQALFNLLSNASKFTDQGTITLEVEREPVSSGDWMRFRVSDTGIGMTPEQMAGLFQEFTQADASTTRKYGGTGLGLVISRRFCQMMGGDINVSSEFGRGSTFTIRLPAFVPDPEPEADEEAAAEAEGDRQAVSPVPANGAVVLAIDDDQSTLELLQRFLGREGFTVHTAASGDEGLRLARELKPAAITLDVMMPVRDGWSVLTALKADPELSDIPVVLLTIVDDRNIGYALGASDYMTKPVDWGRLASVIRKHLPHDRGPSVLVVEDDASLRELLRRLLEKNGWSVTEAANGREALNRVAEQEPGLILLDLLMPEMDGFQFVEELRHRDEGCSIPVVVITAKDMTAEERERLNGCVERILQKGTYTRDELLREVRTLVTTYARDEQPAVPAAPAK
ncbi:MAG: response regulator [Armatimonadota bacterium]